MMADIIGMLTTGTGVGLAATAVAAWMSTVRDV
jgi:hypothetical protein